MLIKGLKVYPERMLHNIELTQGLVFSQRLLIALLETGLSREKSYQIVQSSAMQSWDEATDFRQIIRQQIEVTNRLSSESLESLFDYKHFNFTGPGTGRQ